jgi:hypothetical protein
VLSLLAAGSETRAECAVSSGRLGVCGESRCSGWRGLGAATDIIRPYARHAPAQAGTAPIADWIVANFGLNEAINHARRRLIEKADKPVDNSQSIRRIAAVAGHAPRLHRYPFVTSEHGVHVAAWACGGVWQHFDRLDRRGLMPDG